jgi:tRNA (guanine-N7-)-methyltransferase
MNFDDQEALKKRSIRSFVKRTGRLTRGQEFALAEYWPLYGIDYQSEAQIDIQQLFPGMNQLKLEIGFGNGESLVQMAVADPQSAYIGIEVHEPGVGHCLQRIHEEGMHNLKLMSHDAIEVLQSMIPEQSLERVFLFFPDPWHKKRHNKRRIVNQQFRDLLFTALSPGGVLHMATDWQDYAEHMAVDLFSDPRFKNLGDAQGYCAKPDYRPETKFERRGQRLGHGVWDLLFQKLSN